MNLLSAPQQSFSRKGFTLIEAMVFLFLFSIISVTFFQVYVVGSHMIIDSKNRLGATALANQKMEIIRSIIYDSIGTKHWNGSAWVYGIPGGDLLEDETVSVNTTQYSVHTFVQYVDDAFDGVTPADAIPTDYKRVRVKVSWGNEGTDQTIVVFGNISPNGIETLGGGGVLSINILNASGAGVAGATVHIVNTVSSIDITTDTDATGNITLPGAPAGTEKYQLTVSKNGYYGAITYPAYPTSTYNPIDVHASVVAGTMNTKTIVADQAADITLATKDPFGTSIPNISFQISGGRILGFDPSTAPVTTVYGFSQTTTTDGSGEKTFANQSYGQYKVAISSVQYELYKLNPAGTSIDGFNVVAGVDQPVTAILLDENIGSVKVTVTNQSTGAAFAGASVHLTNVGLGYDVTLTSDSYGLAYFPTALPGLPAGTYTLTVSAAGFNSTTLTVAVSGTLQKKAVALVPN